MQLTKSNSIIREPVVSFSDRVPLSPLPRLMLVKIDTTNFFGKKKKKKKIDRTH